MLGDLKEYSLASYYVGNLMQYIVFMSIKYKFRNKALEWYTSLFVDI